MEKKSKYFNKIFRKSHKSSGAFELLQLREALEGSDPSPEEGVQDAVQAGVSLQGKDLIILNFNHQIFNFSFYCLLPKLMDIIVLIDPDSIC